MSEQRIQKLEKEQVKADMLLTGIKKELETLQITVKKNHQETLAKIEAITTNTVKKDDLAKECPFRDRILSIKFRVGLYQVITPALTSALAAMAVYIWLK